MTSRKVSDIEDIVKKYPILAKAAQLDVTDKASIQKALEVAIGAFGRIDILVNNAHWDSFPS